jgi:hypothetical protein
MMNGIPNIILATNVAEVFNVYIQNNLHNTNSVLVNEKEAYVFEQAKNNQVF